MLTHLKTSAADTVACMHALSHARLSSYRHFFAATDDAQVLALYQWNEELGSALFRTISRVEVVLRNQFHKAFSLRYGAMGSHGSRDWYAHVQLDQRSTAKIQKITHQKRGQQLVPRVPAPSPDDVISGLTFGFWPHLLDLNRNALNQPIDWGAILLDVLPGHRQRLPTHWAKARHRDALFARLDLCNALRNRIAHHEPIWKLGPLMHEARPRPGKPLTIAAPAPTTPADALIRLQLLYGRVTELLGWLSPDMAAQHAASELHIRCVKLLQAETLSACQHARSAAEIDLASLPNLRALRKALRYASRHQQALIIKDSRRIIGRLACN